MPSSRRASKLYLPPNQLEKPLFAFSALASTEAFALAAASPTFLSKVSTALLNSLLASFLYWSMFFSASARYDSNLASNSRVLSRASLTCEKC